MPIARDPRDASPRTGRRQRSIDQRQERVAALQQRLVKRWLQTDARRLRVPRCKWRGGRKRVESHGLVRSILRREGTFSPEGASAAVQRRIEEAKRGVENEYRPEILADAEATAQSRGEG